MLEVLTASGLALAAGLNAWIPLLVLGALDRFTDLVDLPVGWEWLANEWVLLVLVVLLIVEVVADKVPGLDSLNDIVQTVVRPTAGGLAFGSGVGASTVAVTDPEAFFTSPDWIPVAVGVVLALGVHLAKAGVRPVVNASTAGVGAPVVSTVEDVGSVLLSFLAILVPVLIVIALGVMIGLVVVVVRRRRRRRAGTDVAAPGS
ncbi:heme exporter protein D [Agromyces flavus]|uniref:Heme exporter protein D n=1 Tax=Agromyces flavus TaxID=589382 RepID=A0A1H1QZZ7_9MICO|nr:DUF4126 domain-containing protein [Agromyces flavus]MCP2367645.1 heme exporter protein D [Agromyces flavus]GGI47104.1 membrane protein [Agromyces flavus]SDS29104.1 protein of unknown function [Agromyces flavus]